MNILQYVPTVWKTADHLRGAGIKESDFPKFMMLFFALMMVESRILRASIELRKFSDKAFEIIVANPPFGVDWNGSTKPNELLKNVKKISIYLEYTFD